MAEKNKKSEAVSGILSEAETAELDAKLAQMAEETPEVPEDFHARWTEQIRKEAAEKTQNGKKRESRRQWRYVLSAAAVFVFLIGGTLLVRRFDSRTNKAGDTAGHGNGRTPEIRTESAGSEAEINGSAANDRVPEAAYSAAEEPEPEKAAEETALFDAATEDAAEMNETAMEADAEELFDAGEAWAMEEVTEEAAPAGFAMKAESAAGKSAGAAQQAEATEIPVPAAAEAPTEMPEASAAPTETPVPEADREHDGFIGFLADLGVFTLETLAVAAAGFLVIAVIRTLRKKKK